MYAWESIQIAVDYIEAHCGEEIRIEDLASACHLSKFYFQRLFQRLTGKSVMEYIRLRRLARSVRVLREETKKSILEVAVACGFQSHSSFSSVFKEVYGITPDAYRKSEVHLDVYPKPDLSLNHTMADIQEPLVTDQMVLEISRRLVEQDIVFTGQSKLAKAEELGQPKVNMLADLWDTVARDLPANAIGADILTLSDRPGYFNYFVGIEDIWGTGGSETRTMPAGTYIVCRYTAETFELLVDEALYKASRYLYDVWLPAHSLIPENILIQKYFRPFEKDSCIELWAKVKDL